MTDRALKPAEAAAFLGVTASAMSKWRMRGKGPRYMKIGTSEKARIRYNEQDLRAFLDANAKGGSDAAC